MHLSTPRLELRDFTPDDWPAVLAYQSDPRYLRYNPWTRRTEAEVRAFIEIFLRQQKLSPRTHFQLAITLKADGRLIGNCGLRLKAGGATGASGPPGPSGRPLPAEAELGYEISPDHWGQGFATEAARAMLAFGFDELSVHRISAMCIAENLASRRVLEKLGLHLEGHLRDTEWMKGRWWDTLIYAILEPEYRALAGQERS